MSEGRPVFQVACQRCKLAKRRCDHDHPKCSGCRKGNTACIVVDPLTSKQYSRQYIGDLEAEEKALLARLNRDEVLPHQAPNVELSSQDRVARTPRQHDVSTSPNTVSEYVGDSSGFDLLRSIFSNREWTAQKIASLAEVSQRNQMPELKMKANEAPTFEEACALLNNYFSRFHIHHSFLVRDDVFATFDRVYSSASGSCTSQDRFRLFMIFAISAVTRYRAGLSTSHPYGYYIAALRWIDDVPLVGDQNAIQNLLLVARFGMYYHVGISLWDISRSCMRQCVELGYHAQPAKFLLPFDEQKRRRVFWECYILDRYSSSMLGRPFAIADEEITTDLPIVANDETVRTAQALSGIEAPVPQLAAELSVFVFCIKLRRISSRIRTDFYVVKNGRSDSGPATPRDISGSGQSQVKVDHYLRELEHWRAEAPIFANPGCLYERPEWYDYLLETDKLALLRAAMHATPRRRSNRPPPRLLRLNLESAARAIELYADMLNRSFITWTRNYFQTLFTAGMSIIHCLSYGPSEVDHVLDGDRYWPALNTCSSVLTIFQREMPDASIFAMIFKETLKQLALKRPPAIADSGQAQHVPPAGDIQSYTRATDDMLASPTWPGSTVGSTGEQDEFGSSSFLDQHAFLSEDIMQSLEVGLGQYACGFPGNDPFGLDFPEMDFS